MDWGLTDWGLIDLGAKRPTFQVVDFNDKLLYYDQLISTKVKIRCRDLALLIPGTYVYTRVIESKPLCDTMISARAGTQTAGSRVQHSEH